MRRPGSTATWPVLYDQYLQPDWRERLEDTKMWELVARDSGDQELWEVHRKRKRRLVAFVRERGGVARFAARGLATEKCAALPEVLDPDVFTIGFARRFATYKRATLLFRDVDRLKRILNNPAMPVQVVIAGQGPSERSSGQGV